MLRNLLNALADYPQWVAAIAGKLGEATDNGFVLLEPNIQTFEKKVKAPATATADAT